MSRRGRLRRRTGGSSNAGRPYRSSVPRRARRTGCSGRADPCGASKTGGSGDTHATRRAWSTDQRYRRGPRIGCLRAVQIVGGRIEVEVAVVAEGAARRADPVQYARAVGSRCAGRAGRPSDTRGASGSRGTGSARNASRTCGSRRTGYADRSCKTCRAGHASDTRVAGRSRDAGCAADARRAGNPGDTRGASGSGNPGCSCRARRTCGACRTGCAGRSEPCRPGDAGGPCHARAAGRARRTDDRNGRGPHTTGLRSVEIVGRGVEVEVAVDAECTARRADAVQHALALGSGRTRGAGRARGSGRARRTGGAGDTRHTCCSRNTGCTGDAGGPGGTR